MEPEQGRATLDKIVIVLPFSPRNCYNPVSKGGKERKCAAIFILFFVLYIDYNGSAGGVEVTGLDTAVRCEGECVVEGQVAESGWPVLCMRGYGTKDGVVWCVNQEKLSSMRAVRNGMQQV